MRSDQKIKVAIIDDDEIIRDSFEKLINQSYDQVCMYKFGSVEESLNELLKSPPDIILMDITLPGMSGIEGIKIIKKSLRNIDILAVTVHDDETLVFDALCAGARGYLTKNISSMRLLEAIREVFNGGSPMSSNIARLVIESFHKNMDSPLSKRETEVLQSLSKGKSYSKIGEALFIDTETVRTHIKNIYFKLEVHSRNEAIEKAERDKLI